MDGMWDIIKDVDLVKGKRRIEVGCVCGIRERKIVIGNCVK